MTAREELQAKGEVVGYRSRTVFLVAVGLGAFTLGVYALGAGYTGPGIVLLVGGALMWAGLIAGHVRQPSPSDD